MHFTIAEGPAPWLTPLVRHRLDRLGLGTVVDRPAIHRLIRAPRAADQFIYAHVRNGLLIPIAWGRYAIPNASTIDLLQRVPDPAWARLLSHAQTLPDILADLPDAPPLLGFLAFRLMGIVNPDVTGTGPTYSMPRRASTMPGVPLQDASFVIDTLDSKPQRDAVRVGKHVVEVPAPSVADTARIFQSSLDPRLTRMANELLEGAPSKQWGAVRDSKPRWDMPHRMPKPGSTRLQAGPPQNYRIYAPDWYLDLTRGAQDAMARRTFRIA